MSDRVTIDIQGHIAIVRLNRPEKKNALDYPMFDAIVECQKTIEENKSIRVTILTGAGDSFCAGMDLANFNPNMAEESFKKLEDRKYGIANIYQQVVYGWRELSVPVIAAIEGYCYGGGLQIMLGADIKYMHPDTKCSILEMRWGIIPDMAGSVLMRHTVRDDIIRELTYTNRVFSGEEAVEYGFATHVSKSPLDDAIQLAELIVNKNPNAIVKAKKLFNEAPYLNPEDGLINEAKHQGSLLMSKNQLEAVFSEMAKRKPNFEDYRE